MKKLTVRKIQTPTAEKRAGSNNGEQRGLVVDRVRSMNSFSELKPLLVANNGTYIQSIDEAFAYGIDEIFRYCSNIDVGHYKYTFPDETGFEITLNGVMEF